MNWFLWDVQTRQYTSEWGAFARKSNCKENTLSKDQWIYSPWTHLFLQHSLFWKEPQGIFLTGYLLRTNLHIIEWVFSPSHFMYMAMQCLQGAGESVRCSDSGVTVFELPCRSWELNLIPLGGKTMLLTSE